SPEDRLAKLEAFCEPSEAQTIALFADLLSVPAGGKYPPPTVTPHQRRELTCAALIEHFVSTARRQPVLMVCEDAHWIDPTSRDVLDALIGRIGVLPMLLIVTYRPELPTAVPRHPLPPPSSCCVIAPRSSSAFFA